MTTRYAFILGRVFTLSLAELLGYFNRNQLVVKILDASPEALIIETETPWDTEKIQKELGGIIKIVRIVDELERKPTDYLNFTLKSYFKPNRLKDDFLSKSAKGKIQIGLSIYLLDMSLRLFGEPPRLGMMVKRALQETGASLRLVMPEPNALALATVAVTKNLLLEKGAEICVFPGHNKVYIGKTVAVQDFEDYGRRDYQRPVRDEKQGMIPPKVAQIMLNFAEAKKGATLLDPMCGIGTILQEGMLMGYRFLGTDINAQAISGSSLNLEWFRNRYKIPNGRYHLDASPIASVHQIVENLKSVKALPQISSIITEGYLGPMYGTLPSPDEIKRNFNELSHIYSEGFADFNLFLPSKARVVMCLPAYKKGQKDYTFFPNLDFATKNGYTLINLIPEDLASALPFLRLTPRKTAVYDRKDQIVAREIVIFEKN